MFKPLTRRLQAWHLRNYTRRRLAMLDDRLLADLGVERSAIDDFVARSEAQAECK